MSEALKALLDYQQADEDGVMVLVSRQAIHEVAEQLKCLNYKLQYYMHYMNSDTEADCIEAMEENSMDLDKPIKQPTVATGLMGESSPEAIVPLSRGPDKKLGKGAGDD